MRYLASFTLMSLAVLLLSCASGTNPKAQTVSQGEQEASIEPVGDFAVAYFASGCFWCVEAVFQSVQGVEDAISGYAGGSKENAKYPLVSSGSTNHVEAVKVIYDPEVIDYATLVKVFFGSQDPTTPNRQGPDYGKQYRSVLYYQNDNEKQIAEDYVRQLEKEKVFKKPIVTEIVPYTTFFPAEDYHQEYENKHPNNSYVRNVSIPRLNKFKRKFPELLKTTQELGKH